MSLPTYDLDYGMLNVANLNVEGVTICPDDILMGKLLGLYLCGKDLDLDREDYLNTILNLSYVDGNSLMAIDVFERLKKIKKLCL